MICTSSYKKCNTNRYNVCSISKDRGKDAGFEGNCFLSLAPKPEFFKTWRSNIGVLPEKENNEYYMREFFKQVLKNLDPTTIYDQLDNTILLCYEDNDQFCHRHIVSAWLEHYIGVEVPEVKLENDKLVITERPGYIKEYLEKLIKENDREDVER